MTRRAQDLATTGSAPYPKSSGVAETIWMSIPCASIWATRTAGSHREASTGRYSSPPTMSWPVPSPSSRNHGPAEPSIAPCPRVIRGKKWAWMSTTGVTTASSFPGVDGPAPPAGPGFQVVVEGFKQRWKVVHDGGELNLDTVDQVVAAPAVPLKPVDLALRSGVLHHEANPVRVGTLGECLTLGGRRNTSPAWISRSTGGRPSSSMIRSTIDPSIW